MGEGAIDHGGPRREFFRLLSLSASEKYFQGIAGNKYFVNNVTALLVYIYSSSIILIN